MAEKRKKMLPVVTRFLPDDPHLDDSDELDAVVVEHWQKNLNSSPAFLAYVKQLKQLQPTNPSQVSQTGALETIVKGTLETKNHEMFPFDRKIKAQMERDMNNTKDFDRDPPAALAKTLKTLASRADAKVFSHDELHFHELLA